LSDKPQPLFNYFKQLFAQVTNPPIDCIREEIITSSETAIGSERNLLKPGPGHARLIELKSPILTNEEFAKLKHLDQPGFKSITLPILFAAGEGAEGLEKAVASVCARVNQAIADGYNVVVLSDRGVNKDWAPIPSLLAVAGVHHHLIREGTRTQVGLVLESGEPREVHHYSLLIGYGCGAINPYLAFETLDDLLRQGLLTGIDHKTACKNYLKAAMKGVIKVISKMGISTVQSYWGAQIFEAVGLKHSVIDK
jgi:glutamate synthase (ferredoxin)